MQIYLSACLLPNRLDWWSHDESKLSHDQQLTVTNSVLCVYNIVITEKIVLNAVLAFRIQVKVKCCAIGKQQ